MAALRVQEPHTTEEALAELGATMAVLDADARLRRRERLGAWWYVVRPCELLALALLRLVVRVAFGAARFFIRTLLGRILLASAVLAGIFYAMGIR